MPTMELRNFSYHLGGHDFGVEHKEKKFNGHLLSEAREGVEGLQLPFLNIMARDKESADQFAKTVNWLSTEYSIDALDIARLINSADQLTGK